MTPLPASPSWKANRLSQKIAPSIHTDAQAPYQDQLFLKPAKDHCLSVPQRRLESGAAGNTRASSSRRTVGLAPLTSRDPTV